MIQKILVGFYEALGNVGLFVLYALVIHIEGNPLIIGAAMFGGLLVVVNCYLSGFFYLKILVEQKTPEQVKVIKSFCDFTQYASLLLMIVLAILRVTV